MANKKNNLEDRVRLLRQVPQSFLLLFAAVTLMPYIDADADDYTSCLTPYSDDYSPTNPATAADYSPAAVKDYRAFIDAQRETLRYPVASPNPAFVPSLETLTCLTTDAPPVERNSWINHRYALMGHDLARCLDPSSLSAQPIANWYIFAVWGSVSAREVITSEKFLPPDEQARAQREDIYAHTLERGRITAHQLEADRRTDRKFDRARKLLARPALEHLRAVHRVIDKRVSLFAETNYQIAAEMIPVGEAFLETFCNPNKATPDPEAFFSRFRPEEALLREAFEYYHLAQHASNLNDKLEKILIASQLQVFHEQARVQKNLRKALALAPRFLTRTSGFPFGDQLIRFRRDIRISSLHPLLVDLEDPRETELLQAMKLDVDPAGETYRNSACGNWGHLRCRQRFLAQLFRETLAGEPELFDFAD